ncbi:hypothetical protein EVAR_81830_1 [Eumeta japonica]|uniref:Uncharacterized protein n=1 Tax=Eumeta variegata TaxID=151549 RepID=A0A4C1XSZ6_EUMVA|nr:hypothetical protein EVAR_81830_1 [Eumeta japonica]
MVVWKSKEEWKAESRARIENENETGAEIEFRSEIKIKSMIKDQIRNSTGSRIESGNEIGIDSKIDQYKKRRNTFYGHAGEAGNRHTSLHEREERHNVGRRRETAIPFDPKEMEQEREGRIIHDKTKR